MENQEEQIAGITACTPAKRQSEEPGVAYPLNRMVSLYYESSVGEWPLSDTEQTALHAKQNEL